MRKYIQILVAFALTIAAIGISKNSSVWADVLLPSNAAKPLADIDINGDGKYTIGGLCDINVAYKGENLRDYAAVDVPAEISREVTFSYPDNLYLSGCHIVHYKQDKIASEMTSDDGNWEVCFGNRPDEKLTIYYYPDDAASNGKAAWLPLPTAEKDTFVCAPSMYTGVYAVGGIFIPQTGVTDENGINAPKRESIQKGTVMAASLRSKPVRISQPGTYSAGGVCELTVDYYVPALENELHVENNIEISAQVPFPDNEGLLYLPGCHVYHYKSSSPIDQVTTDEGAWEICFAAIPNKETTLYFYYSNNDTNHVNSVWSPLKTTMKDGKACAGLTNFTGVYTPVGKEY